MNAQELRIYNYVQNSITGGEFAVNVDEIRRIYLNQYRYIEPIPLTEEWLLKLGAKLNQDNKSFFDLGDFSFTKLEEGFIAWHRGHALGITIQYVHSLQNLYFALTGQELTITE